MHGDQVRNHLKSCFLFTSRRGDNWAMILKLPLGTVCYDKCEDHSLNLLFVELLGSICINLA